ncbi:MAG: DUF1801 domain-containing protein [Dokdonella sp.]
MAAKDSAPAKSAKRATTTPESVEAFLATLDHPHKSEILAVRQIILDADPAITEGIKWNAPSFRTSEYFATFHLRAKDGIQVILHLGAKTRDGSIAGGAIDDPASLLEWLGKDRATVKFHDRQDIGARRSAFTRLIHQWIGHV